MNYFKFFFSRNSILRDFQNFEFSKQNINGKCIELGASENYKKNFLKHNEKVTICNFSNFKSKSKNIINIDLEKISNNLKIRYDNVIIFNVLEHLNNVDIPLININHMLKKNGKVIGSTPFLYRIHGAPKDYFRFSKDSIFYWFKDFDEIQICPVRGRFETIGNFTKIFGKRGLIGKRSYYKKIIRKIDKNDLAITSGYQILIK